MVDRKKLLKGLECCSDMTAKRRHKCLKECPYDFIHNDNCMGDMARDALELLKEQPVKDANVLSKWISTKDRMPEQSGCYLVYRHRFWAYGRGQITVNYWDGKKWFDHYIAEEEYELSEDSVSHWMPLPQLPEEVAQAE